MCSSVPERRASGEDLRCIAAAMLGNPVEALEPAGGGGNNRIYRITCAGEPFALKIYPRQEEDDRDRLGQEFAALQFLTDHGVTCVPKPAAADHERRCAIYEWVEGTRVTSPDKSDIDAVVRFTGQLQSLKDAEDAEALPLASAHCLSAEAAVVQLEVRLERLREVSANEVDLVHFLADEFVSAVPEIIDQARRIYSDAGLDFAMELPPSRWALNPSDFGFHNALKRADGEIVFLDMEYFGWDDPVKLVSDVMWHPGMSLADALKNRYLAGAMPIFEGRAGDRLITRFRALHPLFGAIWCLILLNEFLPERWSRRAFTRDSMSHAEAKACQLGKARHVFEQLRESRDNVTLGI